MSTKIAIRQSFQLLGGAISTILRNPKILYPFAILGFVQMLVMEILFFVPRFPLVKIFGPIVTRLKGAQYLHYPFNFDIMNHWFQSSQIFIFLFITSLLIGKAVLMIARINDGVDLKERMPKVGLKGYVNLVFGFLIIFLFMYGLTSLYGVLIRRAVQIRSTSGIYFIIKQAVLIGAPYFNLLFSIIVTTVLAYLVPLIVIENKNIFAAFIKNFKILWSTFLPLLIVMFVSSLLYVPVLLLKSNYQWVSAVMTPETWQVFVILGVFIMLFIDAIQYTVITTCYLLTKDE